jgi:hypothetical protein
MGKPAEQVDQRTERRRAERAALRVAATMRGESGGEFAAQLIDIATHGCRIQCSEPIAADASLSLDVAGLEPQQCRVIWRCAEFAGLEFERPLAEAELEKLLRDQEPLPAAGIGELRDLAARAHTLAREAGDADIRRLAELSTACAVDAMVEGLRLGEAKAAPPAD